MDYVLKLRGGVIAGRSRLEHRDPSARIARGSFRPGLGYDLIEPIFALGQAGDTEQHARFVRARDALALELWLGSETFDVAQVAIERSADGNLTLSALVPDRRFWDTPQGNER